MRFHNGYTPGMGYYGYYGEPEQMYGQYDPGYGPVGYYAEDPYLSQQYPYAAVDPYSYGYYAEPEYPYGEYEPLEGYGQMPEMVGYDQYEPLQEYYPEPGTSGYVRQSPPSFNAGCPIPTNVSGFGEEEPLQGYVRPSTVNASCGQINLQPAAEPSMPETFKPLW